MPSAESAARGRALLAERIEQAPGLVARVPLHFEALLERPRSLPRALVTTGIGTSEGHARHLAEVAARWLGQPARFATTASLAGSAPPGADADWLVVFSQGLSANARFALRHAEAWGGVLLVTGLPDPADPASRELDADKRAWLEHLAAMGAVQLDLGCGTEYGALLRVVGARLGYAVGWSVLRTLCARRLRSEAALELDPAALHRAQVEAPIEASRAFPGEADLSGFFGAERSLVLVAEGGLLELCEQLSLKIAEGMLRPAPRCVDVLHFAHGPLQSLTGRPTSILYLAGPSGAESEWLTGLRATLDLAQQDLRVLHATLPAPFSVIEYEAIFDALVLRLLDSSGIDLVDWPGREREAALYEKAPDRPASRSAFRAQRAEKVPWILEESVWPEIETALAAGRRSALIGLGSVEQHGPHLPLGTDRWIAAALGRGLATRLDEAVLLPPIAFGCAREHLAFPGTLHLEPATLEALLGDLLDSLASHGFERAFVFTAHGGNVEALEAMRERLIRRAHPLRLVLETRLDRVAAMQADAVVDAGLERMSAGPHAGEYETSVVAALRVGSVRRGDLSPGRLASPEKAQGFFHPSLRDHAPRGVVGDPSAALADRGASYLSAWIDLLEEAYRAGFGASAGIGRTEKKLQ